MKFEDLSKQLDLNSLYSEQKLQVIKSWCKEEVSSDRFFLGSGEEKYRSYCNLARDYFDHFLPSIRRELDKPVPEFNNRNTIQEAVTNGFDRFLSKLSPGKEELNLPNSDGMTLLHIAASEGYLGTVATLLTLGADPSILNKQKQTPLYCALFMPILYEEPLKNNKIKIFNLLKQKAPHTIGLQDENLDSVMHQMAAQGFSTLLADALQSNPEIALLKNNLNHYPVHTAILNHQIDCLKLLLQSKGVYKLVDNNGWGYLHYAARYGNKEIVSLCCKRTSFLKRRDFRGRTSLMLAAEVGNTDALSILITQGADVSLTDPQGFTALHYAVYGGSLNAVIWLLENTTTNVNAPDQDQQTPLAICERAGHERIKTYLLERGAVVASGTG